MGRSFKICINYVALNIYNADFTAYVDDMINFHVRPERDWLVTLRGLTSVLVERGPGERSSHHMLGDADSV